MTKVLRKLEFFAWYEFAYTADTSHLSREEDYAYWRIMREIFRTAQDSCRIRDDDDYLRAVSRASREEWPSIRRSLIDGAKPLLRKHRGGWVSQPRLTKEIRTAQEKSAKARVAVDERERIRRSSDDDRPINGGSSSKRESKSKTKERETTTTGARARAIEVRQHEVARWLDDNSGVIQCLHCAPHTPHAPGRCVETYRDDSPCDCQHEGETRLSPAAAVAFKMKFQRTWAEWCVMRDALGESAA